MWNLSVSFGRARKAPNSRDINFILFYRCFLPFFFPSLSLSNFVPQVRGSSTILQRWDGKPRCSVPYWRSSWGLRVCIYRSKVSRIELVLLISPFCSLRFLFLAFHSTAMGLTTQQLHFTDDKVCRNFLCGTCPHDLFSNTVSSRPFACRRNSGLGPN